MTRDEKKTVRKGWLAVVVAAVGSVVGLAAFVARPAVVCLLSSNEVATQSDARMLRESWCRDLRMNVERFGLMAVISSAVSSVVSSADKPSITIVKTRKVLME